MKEPNFPTISFCDSLGEGNDNTDKNFRGLQHILAVSSVEVLVKWQLTFVGDRSNLQAAARRHQDGVDVRDWAERQGEPTVPGVLPSPASHDVPPNGCYVSDLFSREPAEHLQDLLEDPAQGNATVTFQIMPDNTLSSSQGGKPPDLDRPSPGR